MPKQASQNIAHDRHWMRRALTLARRSEGHTRPNPPVGAVIVRDHQKLAEGRHHRAGAPHAEIMALRALAPQAAQGATLYVTLEPCSTAGRTPPCTAGIIAAGIKRVVIACIDQNSKHAGRGVTALQEHGIEVSTGVCESAALELVRPFFKHVQTGRPYVTLKLALTMDGKTADRTQKSQWITGPAARLEVQRMRRRADLMLIGAGTVCADDPSLLCRLAGAAPLTRLVVDSHHRTPLTAQIYNDNAAAQTIIAATQPPPNARSIFLQQQGVAVWQLPDNAGHVDLMALLQRMGEAGYMHVLCEGGAALAGALHAADLIDEYCFFYAPAILGDRAALGAVAGTAPQLLADINRLKLVDVKRFGSDIRIRARKE